MMEQLTKIEDLINTKEYREIGQAMLLQYMKDMTPVDPFSFVNGKRYDLLVGIYADMVGFGISSYKNVKFTQTVHYGEGKGFMMIIFRDNGLFVRSDYILKVEESTRLSSQ
jgi:hypothetical protein